MHSSWFFLTIHDSFVNFFKIFSHEEASLKFLIVKVFKLQLSRFNPQFHVLSVNFASEKSHKSRESQSLAFIGEKILETYPNSFPYNRTL